MLGERVDKELNDWLRDARQRTRVEYREEFFR